VISQARKETKSSLEPFFVTHEVNKVRPGSILDPEPIRPNGRNGSDLRR
jgi:hypothetical protein